MDIQPEIYHKIRTNYPRIYMVGYMGSGKTTLGRQLAKELNYRFVDLDEKISEKEKAGIAVIFSEKGEEYFRNSEHSSLVEISSETGLVIATGGGTPCFSNNMMLMKNTGIPVYIKQSPEVLYQRLRDSVCHRPLLEGRNEKDLRVFIINHLSVREPFYTQAGIIIPGLIIKEVHESVMKIINRLDDNTQV